MPLFLLAPPSVSSLPLTHHSLARSYPRRYFRPSFSEQSFPRTTLLQRSFSLQICFSVVYRIPQVIEETFRRKFREDVGMDTRERVGLVG